MKSQHIALPGLQAAAIAFFAAQAAEAKAYCSNADREVVADTNCDGRQPAGTFLRFGSDAATMPVGTVLDAGIKTYDDADWIRRQNAEFPPPDLLSGGFGKRQCGNDDGRAGG